MEVFACLSGSALGGSKGLIGYLQKSFATFGVPEELSSDGEPEFPASHTRDFLTRWGVEHRISSAYNPRSNGRAEVAVKAPTLLKRWFNWLPSSKEPVPPRTFTATEHRRSRRDISPAQAIFGKLLRNSMSDTLDARHGQRRSLPSALDTLDRLSKGLRTREKRRFKSR